MFSMSPVIKYLTYKEFMKAKNKQLNFDDHDTLLSGLDLYFPKNCTENMDNELSRRMSLLEFDIMSNRKKGINYKQAIRVLEREIRKVLIR